MFCRKAMMGRLHELPTGVRGSAIALSLRCVIALVVVVLAASCRREPSSKPAPKPGSSHAMSPGALPTGVVPVPSDTGPRPQQHVPRARVSITTTAGGPQPDAAMEELKQRVLKCYQETPDGVRDAQTGPFSVKARVGKEGRTAGIEFPEQPRRLNATMRLCVETSLSGTRFSAPDGGDDGVSFVIRIDPLP